MKPIKKAAPGRASKIRRYAALLRGVSPMNASMPELRRAFESAGFGNVVTVIASGNVVFDAPAAAVRKLERQAEAAMQRELGQAFLTIVRPIDFLREILAADPYRAFRLPAAAKRVVSFLRDEPEAALDLPLEVDGARILCVKGREIFTAYVPSPRGGAFMALIEKTFGKEITTRTWDTLKKIAR